MATNAYAKLLAACTSYGVNVATVPIGAREYLAQLLEQDALVEQIMAVENKAMAQAAIAELVASMPAPAVVVPSPPPVAVQPPPLRPMNQTQATRVIAAPRAMPPSPAPVQTPQPSAPAPQPPVPVAQAAAPKPATPANGTPAPAAKPATPAPGTPAPAGPAAPGGSKQSSWKAMSRMIFYLLIGLVALTLIGTLVDAFAPPEAANQVADTVNKVSGIKLGFDWSGIQHAMDNMADNLNQPWVKRLVGVTTILLLLAMLDTVSNFTGADVSAVIGYILVILAIPLMQLNAPLAVGLVGIGSALIRRDRDEGKAFWYATMAVGFVLLFVSYVGRDWESWTTETTGKAIAKLIIGGYFQATTASGPIIAIGILIWFYGTYFKDLSMDGTMKSALLVTISVFVAMGFVPFFNKTMAVIVPGVFALQWIGSVIPWIMALTVELREAFARQITAGKGAINSILAVSVFLGFTFWVADLGNSKTPLGIAVWYGIMTFAIAILLGVISGIKHTNVTVAGWKPWVSDWEGLLGDIITHEKLPWIFYPTLFNLGWLGLGLLALFGKVP